jgi:hypothetical protein
MVRAGSLQKTSFPGLLAKLGRAWLHKTGAIVQGIHLKILKVVVGSWHFFFCVRVKLSARTSE